MELSELQKRMLGRYETRTGGFADFTEVLNQTNPILYTYGISGFEPSFYTVTPSDMEAKVKHLLSLDYTKTDEIPLVNQNKEARAFLDWLGGVAR